MELILMEFIDMIGDSATLEKQEHIDELENKASYLNESNPLSINDKLYQKGFINTSDAVHRLYTVKDGTEYYLMITRDATKKFQLNYAWCVKENNQYVVVSEIYTSNKTIFEDKPKRNKMLGKYTVDYNIPRAKQKVADFLNETWQLIFDATDCLAIFKDVNTEFVIDKYSDNSIMQEYLVLSDILIDGGYQFRLLYGKSESYYLFIHNNATDEDCIINFNWQTNPIELLKADASDDKIQLFYEKIQAIDTELDMFKIKDVLFKSIVNLEKDMNKKMELLNNASSFINDVIMDLVATLRTKYFDNLKSKIKKTFAKHQAPTKQMLVDYINLSDEFFVVHDIKKRFKKTSHGFVEITVRDISNFFNNEFGYNKVSMKKCYECMDYITRELAIDYDIIQFKNGLYNTLTGEFMQDKFASENIPKLNLTTFCYIENAAREFKETKLYSELQEILATDRDKWKNWNEEIFYKSVGSCYHATNVAEKMFIIVGQSDSRKSTILQIIKRIFNNNYCNLKIQQIVKNDRFELVPTVNKAILIDDDASDLQLKNIGNLNSFVTATGLYVEFKNMNDGVYLDEYNTPRIWCASNELFNVIGSGFKRRLCLILADNVFDRDKSSKHYMIDIKNGERDKELELMISYSLQLYESKKDQAFLTKEQEDEMFKEFEFKSYAERRFVQDVFTYADEIGEQLDLMSIDESSGIKIDNVDVGRWFISYEDKTKVENVNVESDNGKVDAVPTIKIPTFIPKKQASIICRKYLRYQKQQGTIFDSQAIPSSKKIKTAMEMFGFNQTKKTIVVDGSRTTINVFENVVIKEDWIQKLGLEKLYDELIDET